MSKLEAADGWVRAETEDGDVWVSVFHYGEWAHTGLALSVEEAVQFSRMIVKAAAQAAGLETASEAVKDAAPTGDTRTP